MTFSVLILGARGRLGSAAARAFVAAGWQVLGQVRPGAPVGGVAGVRWLQIDLQDTAALVNAARGAQLVLHALNPPYPKWASEVPALMQSAIRVARELDAGILFPGNVYNFGAGMPAVINEDTPQQPTSRKGQLRKEVEQQLANSGVRSVVIRAGDFFGSGAGSWFDLALVKDITKGKVTLPGVRDVSTPWAYLPDLAQVFVAVAQRWLAQPELLPRFSTFCYGGYNLRGEDWIAALESVAHEKGWVAQGQTLKVGAMPWGLFKALGFMVPLFRELAEMQYLGRTRHALNEERLKAYVGTVPHTPLPVALRSALVDLGKV